MRLKSPSKESQKAFQEHLRKLFENPEVIVPHCIDGGLFCPFTSYEKKLSSSKSNFEKFSKSADQFLSGIAESYKVVNSDALPLLGMIKTQFGSVEFAKRGDTDENVLAGIQHYDDPLWRMMAHYTLSKSKGVRIYSSTNYFLASCKNTSPGKEFFIDALKDEGIDVTVTDDTITIGSMGNSMTITHLNSVTFKIFENSNHNTMMALLRHELTPDVWADFKFSFDYLQDQVAETQTDLLESYSQGRINDREVIKLMSEFREKEAIKKGAFMVGTEVYPGPEEFVNAHDFIYVDKDVITRCLKEYGKGIRMDTFSERKVLDVLWPGFKMEILKSIFPSEPDSFLNSAKGSPTEQIIALKGRLKIDELKISAEGTTRDSAFLVDILKNYFSYGKDRTIRNFEKSLGESVTRKAIFLAFLDSVGERKNREWQFTETETDLAQKISPHIKNILKAGPDHATEKIEKIKAYVR